MHAHSSVEPWVCKTGYHVHELIDVSIWIYVLIYMHTFCLPFIVWLLDSAAFIFLDLLKILFTYDLLHGQQ